MTRHMPVMNILRRTVPNLLHRECVTVENRWAPWSSRSLAGKDLPDNTHVLFCVFRRWMGFVE